MKPVLKKISASLMAIILIFSMIVMPVVIYAGWVDDWIDQKSTSSPSYVAGQDRGYFSAGGFSARVRTSSDYLLTVEKPRLKGGCGGIDMFLGGLGFLNFDFLVKKLQRIMQVAPGFAFDLALKALCSECSESLSKMENFVNALNSLQLDDCKAGKELVYNAADTLTLGKNAIISAEKKRATSDFMVSSGLQSMSQQVNKILEGQGLKPVGQAANKNQMTGCPASLMRIFADGSLLKNIAQEVRFSNSTMLDMVRGKYGDANIATLDGELNIQVVPPCTENAALNVSDFMKGKVWARNEAGTCKKIDDVNGDIHKYVRTHLDKVMRAMRERGNINPDSDEYKLMAYLPLSVYMVIRTAVMTGQDNLIDSVSTLAATALTYRMMNDFLSTTSKIKPLMDAHFKNAGSVSSDANPETCQTIHFEGGDAFLQSFDNKVKLDISTLAGDYNNVLAEIGRHTEFLSKMREFHDMAEKDLAMRSIPSGTRMRAMY